MIEAKIRVSCGNVIIMKKCRVLVGNNDEERYLPSRKLKEKILRGRSKKTSNIGSMGKNRLVNTHFTYRIKISIRNYEYYVPIQR